MPLVSARYASLLGAVALSLLVGCASRSPAPVVELGMAPPPATEVVVPAAVAGEFYTVKKGDTIYSIALDHGQSPRDVAAWNNIDNRNVIRIGQQLRVKPPQEVAVVKPVIAPGVLEARAPVAAIQPAPNSEIRKREPKGGKQPYSEQAVASAQGGATPRVETQVALAKPASASPDAPPTVGELGWAWPSNGKLLTSFADSGGKGIDIGGRIGDSVVAAEAGKVTYAGNAIRGYGNLLIILHTNGLSSVYAHNSKLLAKEGQMVTRGQKVAEIGNTDADQPKLHFEIRRQGKPLDPLKQLSPR